MKTGIRKECPALTTIFLAFGSISYEGAAKQQNFLTENYSEKKLAINFIKDTKLISKQFFCA